MKKWSDVWKSSVIISYLVMGGLMGLSSATYAGGKVNLLILVCFSDDCFVCIFEEQSGCELT